METRFQYLFFGIIILFGTVSIKGVFETSKISPAFELNGVGENVDSLAFWIAPDVSDSLLFVTAKDNDLVEVWGFPFVNNEKDAVVFGENINGVVVDQEANLLYVSGRSTYVLTLPQLDVVRVFGKEEVNLGENNLTVLKEDSGRTSIFVTDDHSVHRYDSDTYDYLGAFRPLVSSIETVVADNYYQILLVPEEQGPMGDAGVFVYLADGTPYEREGTNRFGGSGVFEADEEGILLYTFPMSGVEDNGTGFYVVSDQRAELTDFEFFDRVSWRHLGTLRIDGVSNTDGIASTQKLLPGYPIGLFAAVNDDKSVVCVGWDLVLGAIEYDFPPEAIQIIAVDFVCNNDNKIIYNIVFNEPVINFDDGSDLVVLNDGVLYQDINVEGEGANYRVEVSGLEGHGHIALSVSLLSDVVDLQGNSLLSSVRSEVEPVIIPYLLWAENVGLDFGVNAGLLDDPDGDTRLNVNEFALNGDPLSGRDNDKCFLEIKDIDGISYLMYTIPVRSGAVFTGGKVQSAEVDGITYFVGGSSNLAKLDVELLELVDEVTLGLPALEEGWHYRKFGVPYYFGDIPQAFIHISTTF